MESARFILAPAGVFTLLLTALWALRRGQQASGGIRPSPLVRSKIGCVLRTSPFGRGSGEGTVTPAMERIARLILTPQHTLHLVRIHGKDLLVATHAQGCSVVTGFGRDASLPTIPSASAGQSPSEFETRGGAGA